MLVTVIAILCVDFPAFPRRFVKTETFGTGLVCDRRSVQLTPCCLEQMDVGVGAFIFSHALTSAQAAKRRVQRANKVSPRG
jgi:phosphatidylinositol glycan class W